MKQGQAFEFPYLQENRKIQLLLVTKDVYPGYPIKVPLIRVKFYWIILLYLPRNFFSSLDSKDVPMKNEWTCKLKLWESVKHCTETRARKIENKNGENPGTLGEPLMNACKKTDKRINSLGFRELSTPRTNAADRRSALEAHTTVCISAMTFVKLTKHKFYRIKRYIQQLKFCSNLIPSLGIEPKTQTWVASNFISSKAGQ